MSTPARRESVLITGANGSLGRAMALTLASHGFRVWTGVRDLGQAPSLRDAAAGRGVEVDVVRLDVTDPVSVSAAIDAIVAAGDPFAGVVNNAAVTLRGYFEDLTDQEIRQVIEVNLFGLMNVTRRALPVFRAAGRGRFVNLSSVAGRVASMGLSAYIASKFAIEGFSESLFLELKPLGIPVVIVEPGIVRTDIWGKNRRVAAGAQSPASPYARWFARAEEEADALVRTSTLTPEAVAATVLEALTARRPRLRYTVGRRASLVMSLRRHLPGELFERLYFGEVLRRVTGKASHERGAR